jgi:hypothetical protein
MIASGLSLSLLALAGSALGANLPSIQMKVRGNAILQSLEIVD